MAACGQIEPGPVDRASGASTVDHAQLGQTWSKHGMHGHAYAIMAWACMGMQRAMDQARYMPSIQ
jgi:hypothetical protein